MRAHKAALGLAIGLVGVFGPVMMAQAGSPKMDSVSGSGQNNPPSPTADIAHFAFNVRANTDDTNVTGEAHFKVTADQNVEKNGTFGSPTCLIIKQDPVTGANRASFIFAADHTASDAEFDTINGVDYPVIGVQTFINDNGKQTGNNPVDQVKNRRLNTFNTPSGVLPGCEDPITGPHAIQDGFPVITKGDIRIDDN
jgi:hypothetical protein